MRITIDTAGAAADSAGTRHKFHAAGVLQLRREMRGLFGWKENYGSTVNSSEATRRRGEAEVEADAFVARCAEVFGTDKEAIERLRAMHQRLRLEFGWRADYGLTVSTAKAVSRRAEAEMKADEAVAKMF